MNNNPFDHFGLPEKFLSKRAKIVAVYIEERSVPRTAHRLKYQSPSWVRKVINEYKDYLRNEATSKAVELTQ